MLSQAAMSHGKWRVAIAGLCGFGISAVALVLSWLGVGGGEGTTVPALSLFAPAALVWMLLGGGDALLLWVLLLMAVLYPIYAVCLNLAPRFRPRLITLLAIVVLHYGSAIIVLSVAPSRYDWAQTGSFGATITWLGLPYTVGCCALIVLTHVLAAQYVRFPAPYRPRWDRASTTIVILGLAAALPIHYWIGLYAR